LCDSDTDFIHYVTGTKRDVTCQGQRLLPLQHTTWFSQEMRLPRNASSVTQIYENKRRWLLVTVSNFTSKFYLIWDAI